MSLKQLALDTLALVGAGEYTAPSGKSVSIGADATRAAAATRTYAPAELDALREARHDGPLPEVTVVDATTQVAAQPLAPGVALLNFASARNPGGGFLNGAKAQEEDLCRCSALYPCLEPQMSAYYQPNRRHPDNLYTDASIYSPGVPFFKLRGTGDLLETPFLADVITAPAPNAGASRGVSGETLSAILVRRWSNVLALARAHGRRTVLLGAWGCGAFGNDPDRVAAAFLEALPAFGGDFDHVVFAIPDAGRQSAANHAAFTRRLGALR
ncbi:MAG: TIGR02452 family protein [Alphaproteobacteria bacterium]|nr:TIGR02452 family protein [Alphaproteobacteria bacterium]